jgi:ABC-type transport system substrate-binding protein
MSQIARIQITGFLLLALLVPILAACGGGEPADVQVVRETVVVTAEADDAEPAETEPTEGEEDEAEATPSEDEDAEPADSSEAAEAEEVWDTPHPILSDLRVRQAIAYCTDRGELIQAVYPFLNEADQQALLMDTFLPQGHWALAPEDQITTYPFDPEQGNALLEEAGWLLAEGDEVRANEEGEPLSLKFTTTDAEFRQLWSAVFEQQMIENCGIQIIRTHAPASWWFGARTGLQARDFELGAYAWVGQADPGGATLYSCDQIPKPPYEWEGQNVMGWCNPEASSAINAAVNTLDREERIELYEIVQREFTEDMVSLPLFNRFEAAAASPNLENFRPNPTTDSYVVNIDEWAMADGSDTVILGLTQEPPSLFLPIESALAANIASSMTKVRTVTSYDYDYQPVALEELPYLENGGAVEEVIEAEEGDIVWSTTSAEAVELALGVEVLNADGEIVTYEGEPIEMRQLSVTFELPEGLTWEDGVPVTAEDMELAYNIDCNPATGVVSLTRCNSIEDIDFTSDTSYTINYLPGARWAEYFAYSIGVYSNLFTVGAYPAHRELSESTLESLANNGVELEPGSTLADVPASEWSTLPEVAEQPLSYGPYRLVSWEKGQRMTFEANPYYYKGEPAIKTVVIQFIGDTNQAVVQLLNGSIDVLGQETLGAGPELETVLAADEEGSLQVVPLSSPTWEHVDMNLFLR